MKGIGIGGRRGYPLIQAKVPRQFRSEILNATHLSSAETLGLLTKKLKKEAMKIKRKNIPAIVIAIGLLSVLSVVILADQDRYALQVPNGLSFSEFRGYQDW